MQSILTVAGMSVVGRARSPVEAVGVMSATEPDVVVATATASRGTSSADLVGLAIAGPTLLIVEAVDREHLATAATAGVAGLLLDGDYTADDLVRSVTLVANGSSAVSPKVAAALLELARDLADDKEVRDPDAFGLTTREREIMDLVMAGAANESIANALGLGTATVKGHVNRILAKLGAGSRAEAMARWAGLR
ncbi:MAG: LuxR C-terminal-related transcriptional regulator [Actinomycetota bacterium]